MKQDFAFQPGQPRDDAGRWVFVPGYSQESQGAVGAAGYQIGDATWNRLTKEHDKREINDYRENAHQAVLAGQILPSERAKYEQYRDEQLQYLAESESGGWPGDKHSRRAAEAQGVLDGLDEIEGLGQGASAIKKPYTEADALEAGYLDLAEAAQDAKINGWGDDYDFGEYDGTYDPTARPGRQGAAAARPRVMYIEDGNMGGPEWRYDTDAYEGMTPGERETAMQQDQMDAMMSGEVWEGPPGEERLVQRSQGAAAVPANSDPKPHPSAPYIEIFDWYRDDARALHPDWSDEDIEDLADKVATRYTGQAQGASAVDATWDTRQPREILGITPPQEHTTMVGETVAKVAETYDGKYIATSEIGPGGGVLAGSHPMGVSPSVHDTLEDAQAAAVDQANRVNDGIRSRRGYAARRSTFAFQPGQPRDDAGRWVFVPGYADEGMGGPGYDPWAKAIEGAGRRDAILGAWYNGGEDALRDELTKDSNLSPEDVDSIVRDAREISEEDGSQGAAATDDAAAIAAEHGVGWALDLDDDIYDVTINEDEFAVVLNERPENMEDWVDPEWMGGLDGRDRERLLDLAETYEDQLDSTDLAEIIEAGSEDEYSDGRDERLVRILQDRIVHLADSYEMRPADYVYVANQIEDLGWAVKDQLTAVATGESLADQNPNALELISGVLRETNNDDLRDFGWNIRQYLDAGGNQYMSAATLRVGQFSIKGVGPMTTKQRTMAARRWAAARRLHGQFAFDPNQPRDENGRWRLVTGGEGVPNVEPGPAEADGGLSDDDYRALTMGIAAPEYFEAKRLLGEGEITPEQALDGLREAVNAENDIGVENGDPSFTDEQIDQAAARLYNQSVAEELNADNIQGAKDKAAIEAGELTEYNAEKHKEPANKHVGETRTAPEVYADLRDSLPEDAKAIGDREDPYYQWKEGSSAIGGAIAYRRGAAYAGDYYQPEAVQGRVEEARSQIAMHDAGDPAARGQKGYWETQLLKESLTLADIEKGAAAPRTDEEFANRKRGAMNVHTKRSLAARRQLAMRRLGKVTFAFDPTQPRDENGRWRLVLGSDVQAWGASTALDVVDQETQDAVAAKLESGDAQGAADDLKSALEGAEQPDWLKADEMDNVVADSMNSIMADRDLPMDAGMTADEAATAEQDARDREAWYPEFLHEMVDKDPQVKEAVEKWIESGDMEDANLAANEVIGLGKEVGDNDDAIARAIATVFPAEVLPDLDIADQFKQPAQGAAAVEIKAPNLRPVSEWSPGAARDQLRAGGALDDIGDEALEAYVAEVDSNDVNMKSDIELRDRAQQELDRRAGQAAVLMARRRTAALYRLGHITFRFDPGQPRDEKGRWRTVPGYSKAEGGALGGDQGAAAAGSSEQLTQDIVRGAGIGHMLVMEADSKAQAIRDIVDHELDTVGGFDEDYSPEVLGDREALYRAVAAELDVDYDGDKMMDGGEQGAAAVDEVPQNASEEAMLSALDALGGEQGANALFQSDGEEALSSAIDEALGDNFDADVKAGIISDMVEFAKEDAASGQNAPDKQGAAAIDSVLLDPDGQEVGDVNLVVDEVVRGAFPGLHDAATRAANGEDISNEVQALVDTELDGMIAADTPADVRQAITDGVNARVTDLVGGQGAAAVGDNGSTSTPSDVSPSGAGVAANVGGFDVPVIRDHPMSLSDEESAAWPDEFEIGARKLHSFIDQRKPFGANVDVDVEADDGGDGVDSNYILNLTDPDGSTARVVVVPIPGERPQVNPYGQGEQSGPSGAALTQSVQEWIDKASQSGTGGRTVGQFASVPRWGRRRKAWQVWAQSPRGAARRAKAAQRKYGQNALVESLVLETLVASSKIDWIMVYGAGNTPTDELVAKMPPVIVTDQRIPQETVDEVISLFKDDGWDVETGPNPSFVAGVQDGEATILQRADQAEVDDDYPGAVPGSFDDITDEGEVPVEEETTANMATKRRVPTRVQRQAEARLAARRRNAGAFNVTPSQALVLELSDGSSKIDWLMVVGEGQVSTDDIVPQVPPIVVTNGEIPKGDFAVTKGLFEAAGYGVVTGEDPCYVSLADGPTQLSQRIDEATVHAATRTVRSATFTPGRVNRPTRQVPRRQARRARSVTGGFKLVSKRGAFRKDGTTPIATKAKWEGLLAVEGVPSGDRRTIEDGALTWRNLPLPLMLMTKNPEGGEGHDGAQLAGRIEWIERRDNGQIWGGGSLDMASEAGMDAARLLTPDEDGKTWLSGVSVDLDDIEMAIDGMDEAMDFESLMMGNGSLKVSRGRVMGATLTPFPAFQEAQVVLVAEALVASPFGASIDAYEEALVASAGPAAEGVQVRLWTPAEFDPEQALVASAGGPVAPPLAWFELPEILPDPHPVRVGVDGRMSGFVTDDRECHIGFGHCVRPPKSKSNYRYYANKQTLTAEGTLMATGPIMMDTVHPSLKLQASDTQAFYAHTGCAVADVAVYDTPRGMYVAGAVRPSATAEQVRALRGSDISPDWRTIHGGLECVALLAVNTSGFITPAMVASAGDLHDYVVPGKMAMSMTMATGQVDALVAAGILEHSPVQSLRAELATLRDYVAELGDAVEPLIIERRRHRQRLAAERLTGEDLGERLARFAAARERLRNDSF